MHNRLRVQDLELGFGYAAGEAYATRESVGVGVGVGYGGLLIIILGFQDFSFFLSLFNIMLNLIHSPYTIYALSILYLYTIYAWAMGFYDKDMKKWSMNFGKKGRKRKIVKKTEKRV